MFDEQPTRRQAAAGRRSGELTWAQLMGQHFSHARRPMARVERVSAFKFTMIAWSGASRVLTIGQTGGRYARMIGTLPATRNPNRCPRRIAFHRRAPVVGFADQDQGRHRHVVLEADATRIEGDRRRGTCSARSLDRAAFDRRQRQPAALRRIPARRRGRDRPPAVAPESSGPDGHRRRERSGEPLLQRRLEAARTKAVDGERDIAPGCDQLPQRSIELLPSPSQPCSSTTAGERPRHGLRGAGPDRGCDWPAGSRIRPSCE